MASQNEKLLPPRGAQIPLLDISSIDQAVEFAEDWQKAGHSHVEVLLRSDNALQAVRELVTQTELIVAAGTILSTDQLLDAVNAGAHIAVSPGFTPALAEEAESLGLPLIPGVHTPSEIQSARNAGLRLLKFFPASLGGTQYLSEIGPLFPDIEFIPSGGVRKENFEEFLALPNVRAVGGRWMLPR